MHFHLPKPLHGWREFAGEVGIIVLGILIALGAEQVVESVHSSNKQRATLERLFEESRVNVALLLRRREVQRQHVEQDADFAAALTSGSCPPASAWSAVTDVTKYPQVATENSVYDEVIGAGGLADIRSTQARAALSDFHSKLAWIQSTTDFFRSKADRAFDLDDPRVTLRYDKSAEDPEITIFDRAALCRDHGFRNRVVIGVRNQVIWSSFEDPLVQSAVRLCQTLGRLVGRKCTPASLEIGSD